MRKLIRLKLARYFVVISILTLLLFGFTSIEKSGDKNSGQKLSKVVGAYYMNINNIEMPMNNSGVYADVVIPPNTAGGKYDGHTFLFSGGFCMSGYIDLGTPNEFQWANGVATASRIQDYQPGPVGSNPTDAKNKLYIVRSDEEPFGTSWQEWKDAVSLGADFYDGDKDGVYNPVDKNGNGQWDPDEDRPDLLGDETVWCVINDGIPASQRRYTDVNPLGIEIHQTIFGFASSGLLGNMLFVRYKIINNNPDGKTLDSVYFSVWADPDLGDYTDDLVGCDVPESAAAYTYPPGRPKEGRNAGYTYNQGSDNEYGPNPPTYLIDFFQGPFVYTGNSNDTAFNIKGPYLGVDTLVGYKQLGISSFLQYFQSQPVEQADPGNRIEMRYYTQGYNRQGKPLNPCSWQFGAVVGGVDCNRVDPRFFYSGDPHRNIGWIQTTQADERMMVNTGMFRLEPKDTAVVVAALIVGRGTSATSSIEEAKRISDFAQFIYDQNFRTASAPPAPKVTVRTTENSIDLMWPTAEQVNFSQKTIAYDQRFQGYELWAFRTNSTADLVAGVENAKIIARWDLKDNIDDVLQEDGKTGERKVIYRKGIQLDPAVYGNPQTGFIKYSVTTDPWTGGPIVKGKPYYFAVISYALNHDALVPVDPSKPSGNYYISGAAFIGASANVKKIVQGGILPGQDLNDPYVLKTDVNLQGISEATAYFEEVDKTKLTGDEYEITFFRNTDSTNYFMNWKLVNKTTNDTLVSSSNKYDNLISDDDKYTIPVVDGFIPRITWIPAEIKSSIKSASMTWVAAERTKITGVFYRGSDIPSLEISALPTTLGAGKHTLITADKLAQIEIRFKPGKAYRFVSNTLGTAFTSAAGTTTGIGLAGEYFVNVPFQVWIKDSRKGVEQQLACGFIESRASGGNPDGSWDPGTDISKTREYIIIFDQPYDPEGRQMEYVGYLPTTGTKTYANLLGWNPPAAAGFTPEQTDRAKARWLGAIYVIGLEKVDDNATWSENDVYTIPVSYPLTSNDKFVFRTTKAGQGVTQDYKKSLLDRVNVYPNPLYAYNPTVGYYSDPNNPKNDEPFVTFINLPEEVTIKIYTLSGQLLRVLSKNDASPFMNWDLKNKDGLRAASGVYLAVVSSPGLGEKVLKFSIIQPQKQIKRF